MPDEVHMMRKEIYDSEGYTQRTSMPVWQARCAAQQPTRREHGLRANPVLRARTVALPFLFILCVTDVWPSSSTRRGVCKLASAAARRAGPLRTNVLFVTLQTYSTLLCAATPGPSVSDAVPSPHRVSETGSTQSQTSADAPPAGCRGPPRSRVPGIRGILHPRADHPVRGRGSLLLHSHLTREAARHDSGERRARATGLGRRH